MITDTPGDSSTIDAVARAASVAPETAMPQSAFFSAGASFTPSPVMPTMWPRFCRTSTMWNLCSGKTCAKPSAFSMDSATAVVSCFFESPRLPASRIFVPMSNFLAVSLAMASDSLAIAKETAKKLDMGTNILDASSLGDSKKQETTEVAESIEKADGFAQVFPEHKFHIVDVLQKRGQIVGMTGDGVNDAPALKKADCGIAVSGATDAARAAAAIVLMTPGLSVIIDAIKESRKIFQRMN